MNFSWTFSFNDWQLLELSLLQIRSKNSVGLEQDGVWRLEEMNPKDLSMLTGALATPTNDHCLICNGSCLACLTYSQPDVSLTKTSHGLWSGSPTESGAITWEWRGSSPSMTSCTVGGGFPWQLSSPDVIPGLMKRATTIKDSTKLKCHVTPIKYLILTF